MLFYDGKCGLVNRFIFLALFFPYNKYFLNMRITKLDPEINHKTFQDGRGGIMTYYPQTESIKEWNVIFTNKGSVRGKHYHEEFDEYITICSGGGVYVGVDDGEEYAVPVSAGDCVYIAKNVPHTFYPRSDTVMVAQITKKWNDCEKPITKI